MIWVEWFQWNLIARCESPFRNSLEYPQLAIWIKTVSNKSHLRTFWTPKFEYQFESSYLILPRFEVHSWHRYRMGKMRLSAEIAMPESFNLKLSKIKNLKLDNSFMEKVQILNFKSNKNLKWILQRVHEIQTCKEWILHHSVTEALSIQFVNFLTFEKSVSKHSLHCRQWRSVNES